MNLNFKSSGFLRVKLDLKEVILTRPLGKKFIYKAIRKIKVIALIH